jgi:hypothetical protein
MAYLGNARSAFGIPQSYDDCLIVGLGFYFSKKFISRNNYEMSNTFTDESINWTCPACNEPTLINPDEPEFYCSRRCESAAGEATAGLLHSDFKASRYIVKHLRLFFVSRYELADADERGRLAQAWACQVISDLEYIGELDGRGIDVEYLVMNWKKN